MNILQELHETTLILQLYSKYSKLKKCSDRLCTSFRLSMNNFNILTCRSCCRGPTAGAWVVPQRDIQLSCPQEPIINAALLGTLILTHTIRLNSLHNARDYVVMDFESTHRRNEDNYNSFKCSDYSTHKLTLVTQKGLRSVQQIYSLPSLFKLSIQHRRPLKNYIEITFS